MYKLIGAIIVALAIAAAVLPLWLGGGGSEETESVPLEPKTLGDADTASKSTPSASDKGEEVREEAVAGKSEGESGKPPWWEKSPEEGRPGEPSPSGGKRAPERRPKEPSEEVAGPTQEEVPSPGPSAPPSPPAKEADGIEPPPPSPGVEPPDSPRAPRTGEEERGADSGRPEGQRKAPAKEPPYWTVMVGSFQELANAKRLRDRLQEEGFSARIQTLTIEGSEWNRVLVGALSSRSEAEGVVPRLEKSGHDDTLVMKVE